MNVTFLNSISDISAAQWNQLFAVDYPFTQHAFLNALEASGCTQTSTGWTPQHIVVSDNERLVAAMPCFLKTHSYGEYVFDWAWAEAYQRHGLAYFPKLLCAIPFTPATGPRLAFDHSIVNADQKVGLINTISDAIHEKYGLAGISSWHLLFPDAELSALLSQSGWQHRVGIQYHWFNKEYVSFEAFLSSFKSRKRKAVRKEREAVAKQNIQMEVRLGDDISDQLMDEFYRFYHLTYLKRSGQHGYLNREFFHLLLATMRQSLVMICASQDDKLVGAALCFKDKQTLYGRYWGCEKEFAFLHFEACYYQGIEFCIEHGLSRFDPGAQGEHKIPRGFEPIKTLSNHVILHSEFNRAIDHFINDEKAQVMQHIEYLKTLLPFKN